ncbi:hypothetical protein C8R43DRAFT_1143587, partial [Mycena crocata]
MVSKKLRARVARDNRQNLRLWARGAREEILTPHIESYADALERGWRFEREKLKRITREFNARINWRLSDFEEPPLPLKPFDPDTRLPDDEILTDEEEETKRSHLDVLYKRIRRWLKYRVRRLRKGLRPRLDPRHDPWAHLLAKLSGYNRPPKARQAYQQFFHECNTDIIKPEVERRWLESEGDGASLQTSKEPNAPFRSRVA